jgi:hypothetical protein
LVDLVAEDGVHVEKLAAGDVKRAIGRVAVDFEAPAAL